MTTNSPNPVDGDVQALISWLEEGIICSSDYGFTGNVLKSMRIALASLTAKPVGWQRKDINALHTNWSPWSDVFEDMGALENSISKNKPEHAKHRVLYTTPPAQLLRPVELPQGRLMQVAFETDPVNADMYLCISRDAAVRAIREAGGEVKND